MCVRSYEAGGEGISLDDLSCGDSVFVSLPCPTQGLFLGINQVGYSATAFLEEPFVWIVQCKIRGTINATLCQCGLCLDLEDNITSPNTRLSQTCLVFFLNLTPSPSDSPLPT